MIKKVEDCTIKELIEYCEYNQNKFNTQSQGCSSVCPLASNKLSCFIMDISFLGDTRKYLKNKIKLEV